jgi:hypothetical protein
MMVAGEATDAGPGCTGKIDYSTDNCTISVDFTCPAPDSKKVEVNGTLSWTPDGTKGTGIVEYTVFAADGTVQCSGTYDETSTKH